MPLNFANWLLAATPIIVMLVLMLGVNWGGSKAGAAAWLAAILVALAVFGASPWLLLIAQLKSLLLTLDVLYIIWMALLLFHVADEAGAISVIGERLPRLTSDRTMQALLLGWVFVSFLQGIGGFGVPVAVVAPLLVSLGFAPVQAVIMASLGHGWAITFGSLAISYQTLIATTNVPGEVLAPDSALLMGLVTLASGAAVAHAGAGWKGLLRGLPMLLVLSVVMSGMQYVLATNGLWTLGATVASLTGLAVGIGLTTLPWFRRLPIETPAVQTTTSDGPRRSLRLAMSIYAVLILLAILINLVPSIKDIFNQVTISFEFPALSTSLGWETPAEAGRRISVFGHPGAILLYSSLIGALIYASAGYYKPGAVKRILQKVWKGGGNASLGITAMVGMAVIMSHTGMTNLLARGISEGVSARVYPLVAPFVGALGAFMTGSNTNSNVVFGLLQKQTAELLGLSVTLILAAQTTGGSLGSVLAPAKVIVGCSTVGLSGKEGPVIGKMLLYGLLTLTYAALLTWLLATLRGG
mgnify:CR=1 FL=1